MNLIAAVDKQWAIGHRNGLLIRIPADMKLFRQETMGKVVVLGRKTLETFPGGQPLQGRTNIILSAKREYQVRGARVARSLKELLEALKEYDSKEVYVIGGESVYRQLLPYCDTAHITRIDRIYEADAYFPNLEKEGWAVTAESDEQSYFDTTYRFVRYEKRTC